MSTLRCIAASSWPEFGEDRNTANVGTLRLLSLLETRRYWPGAELAEFRVLSPSELLDRGRDWAAGSARPALPRPTEPVCEAG